MTTSTSFEIQELMITGNFGIFQKTISTMNNLENMTLNLDTNISILPKNGIPLMHFAAFYDNLEAFIILEKAGCSLRSLSSDSYWPLHYACENGSSEVASYILSRDPDQAKIDTDTNFQAILISIQSDSPDILEMLLNYGANLESPKNKLSFPLERAIRTKHFSCLLVLLNHECKIQVKAGFRTPLMIAVAYHFSKAILPLIDLGCDPQTVSADNETALSLACESNDIDIVKQILQRIDRIEIPSGELGNTPSIARSATRSGNPEILELIIQRGCDFDRFDKCHELPIDSLRGFVTDEIAVKMLQIYVKYGFDVNLRESQSPPTSSFLERVIEFDPLAHMPKLIDALLEAGAKADSIGPDGKSAIQMVKNFVEPLSPPQMEIRQIFSKYFPEQFS